MTRVRTLDQLQGALDAEFSWRLKEIADLKLAVKQGKNLTERTLIRAGVTLLYAHWEGFVKSAALTYISYVNDQGRRYQELETCFVILGLKKYLNELSQTKKTKLSVAALEFIRDCLGNRAKLQIDSGIDTESNLKSEVFSNIALGIGISIAAYESRFKLMDESLLKRRNKIAHGEFLDLTADSWRELADEILSLMRQFKTDIENAASLSKFVRSDTTVVQPK